MEGILSGLLRERLPADQARVRALLEEGRRLQEWIGNNDLPADLRAHLRASRAERSLELMDCLCRWVALGGDIAFVAPEANEPADDPVPVNVSEPPVQPPAPAAAMPEPVRATALSEPDPRPKSVVLPPVRPEPPVPPAAPPNDGAALRTLVRDLAETRTPSVEIAFLLMLVRDASRLDRIVPPSARLDALAYASARMRHLQEVGEAGEQQAGDCMSAVAAYARSAQIGSVYGPNRMHTPRRASWAEDARVLLSQLTKESGVRTESLNPERCIRELEQLVGSGGGEEEIQEHVCRCFDAGVAGKDPRLVRILTPVFGVLDGKRFKDTRAAIREKVAADSDVEDAVPAARVPPDWPHWHLTRGKRAVMVGGDPREQNRVRIQESFGFASLGWVRTEFRVREVDALRESVERGGVDMVIVLTPFVGHTVDDKLVSVCRDRGVPYVPVHSGYGIVGIREAIQRHGST